MQIDPLAAEYLIATYRGEMAVKSTDSKVIHNWAAKTIDGIFGRYESVKNNEAMNHVSNPVQSVMKMILPQRGDPKPRPKKKRRDYSLEFIDSIVSAMGGQLDNSEKGYSLPDTAPNYDQAIASLKLLMKRAFELQMIPKGLWLYGMIIMSVLLILAFGILFIHQSLVEYVMAGSFFALGLYSFIRWRTFPKFKKVAGAIKDLVYAGNNSIDEMVNSK